MQRCPVPAQTIIVADDDKTYLEMIKDVLEDEGYPRVICMVSPDVEAIAQERPTLILLDVHHSLEEEGWRLLNFIRLHRDLQDVPVIICSTNPVLLEEKGPWLAKQGCTTLEKPFRIDDLLAAVAARLGLRERSA